jgi:hypothetical protein
MWNVCFGQQDGWEYGITKALDRERFLCCFSDLQSIVLTNFDCVVPLTLEDYRALRSTIGLWGKKFWSPIPKVVALCDDKLLLNRSLLNSEFAKLVPPLLDECNTGQFPYIVKKRHDGFGRNSFIVWNAQDERTLAPRIHSPEYFRQTYISGNVEYALHILLVDQRVAYARTVKYELGRKFYVKGANLNLGRRALLPDIRTTYLPDNEYIATFSSILVALGYVGTCCINYKMHDGLPMLLEINPRFGASLIGDINRYMEAYLCSLGIADEADFQQGNVPRDRNALLHGAMLKARVQATVHNMAYHQRRAQYLQSVWTRAPQSCTKIFGLLVSGEKPLC